MHWSYVSRYVRIGVLIGLTACILTPRGQQAQLQADTSPVGVWWPVQGAKVDGVQPFKAVLSGLNPSVYRMTWSVDNGNENPMHDSWQGSPHKEASVDVSKWAWNGAGPYNVAFRAYNMTGHMISTQKVNIFGPGAQAEAKATPQASAPSHAAPTPTARAALKSANVSNQLFALPGSPALSTAANWSGSRPAEAAIMARIGNTPTAQWFGGWNANITGDVDSLVTAGATAGKTPVLVAYNIPSRDCGSYSGGGSSRDAYATWIRAFAAGLKNRSALVILEPDALAQVDCLSGGDKAARYAMLADAVNTLKASSGSRVYLDAGHPGWVDPDTMASRLSQAGIDRADGFSLNVSNFISTDRNIAYGKSIAAKTGGKQFVIDTSRNGRGGSASGEWCNPSNQALGNYPTTMTNEPLVAAYLWVKKPGESDGACNGGPSAGTWWPDYALQLAHNAGY